MGAIAIFHGALPLCAVSINMPCLWKHGSKADDSHTNSGKLAHFGIAKLDSLSGPQHLQLPGCSLTQPLELGSTYRTLGAFPMVYSQLGFELQTSTCVANQIFTHRPTHLFQSSYIVVWYGCITSCSSYWWAETRWRSYPLLVWHKYAKMALCNVVKTIVINRPKIHHFCRWYGYHSQSWVDMVNIVLPTW